MNNALRLLAAVSTLIAAFWAIVMAFAFTGDKWLAFGAGALTLLALGLIARRLLR